MSGDFWGSQEGCQGPSRPSGRNRGLPLRRRRGQGLACSIPWVEESGTSPWGRKESDTTSLSLFTFIHWRRKWQPTPVFLPGESQGKHLNFTPLAPYSVSREVPRSVLMSIVGSVHFWLVPWSDLYFSRSIGAFLCSPSNHRVLIYCL